MECERRAGCIAKDVCEYHDYCLVGYLKASGFGLTEPTGEPEPFQPALNDAELVKLRRHMALWPE